ncbi:PKD repeat protein [Arthrobacter sp. CAN_A1]
MVVSVDGSGSSDSDGTVAGYAWTFGDGGTATGVNASHTFGAAGTYPVRLTVTDDDGATHSRTTDVTVTAPPVNNVIAQDGFQRTVTGGLGTADVGGAWSLNGSASLFAVSDGTATIRMNTAGSGPSANLNSISSATAESSVDMGLDKVANGGGTFITLTGRRVGTAGEYRAKVKVAANGAVSLDLTRAVGTVVTTLQSRSITGLTYAVGDQLTVKFLVSGTSPTTLGAKVWKKGTTEPVAWQVSGTDSATQLQFPGGVGLTTYVSGSSTNAPIVGRFSNLFVRNSGA